ncbi:biuret amidohydrolase [Azospirillaceae bacterium]
MAFVPPSWCLWFSMPIISVAKPYAFCFPLSRVALVAIDFHRDSLDEGGYAALLGNDVSHLRALIPVAEKLIDACRSVGLTIIHVREGHRSDLSDCPPAKRIRVQGAPRIGETGPLGRFLVRDELGNQFPPKLAPRKDDVVIDKTGKSAFYGTDLDIRLRRLGVSHLLLAGVTAEHSVLATLLHANDLGYECLVVEDAVDSYEPALKQAALAIIDAQKGVLGWRAPSHAVLEALLGQ